MSSMGVCFFPFACFLTSLDLMHRCIILFYIILFNSSSSFHSSVCLSKPNTNIRPCTNVKALLHADVHSTSSFPWLFFRFILTTLFSCFDAVQESGRNLFCFCFFYSVYSARWKQCIWIESWIKTKPFQDAWKCSIAKSCTHIYASL